ncbi:MAG: hypothetical protein EOM80_14460 [Erysipelotrichia bacterium]|nr:hypothetical protein [Erysipelotrichia bacterium]
MEIVIIVLAVVFSVWSEINKKKQEENVDMDFSELTSLDDFFKKTSASAAPPVKTLAGKKRSPRNSESESLNYDNLPALTSKEIARRQRAEVNYDELPSLTGKSYDQAPGRAEVNYDELPTLSGQTNFEDDVEDEGLLSASAFANRTVDTPPLLQPGNFTFDRNDLLKSFVMNEVLQRYNISRIYDRIPGINPDN